MYIIKNFERRETAKKQIHTTSFSKMSKRWKKLDLFEFILVNMEVIPVIIIPFKTMTPVISFKAYITQKLIYLCWVQQNIQYKGKNFNSNSNTSKSKKSIQVKRAHAPKLFMHLNKYNTQIYIYIWHEQAIIQ